MLKTSQDIHLSLFRYNISKLNYAKVDFTMEMFSNTAIINFHNMMLFTVLMEKDNILNILCLFLPGENYSKSSERAV